MIRFVVRDGAGVRTAAVPRWAVALVMAGAVGLGLLLMLLAAGVALVVVPLAIAAAGVAGWIARRRSNARRPSAPAVIDAEYRVLDAPDRR